MLKSKPSVKKISVIALSAAMGALLSCGRILTFPAPFAVLLASVLSPVYGVAALIGSLLGGIVSVSTDIIPTVAAAGTALITRLRMGGLSSKRGCFTVSALSSAVYLISASALFAFSGGGLGELLRALIFAAALFGGMYAFTRASALLRSASGIPPALMMLICGTTVCALCPLGLWEFSAGGILAVYCILFAALRCGQSASVLTAAVCAVGAGMASPNDFGCFALTLLPAMLSSFPVFGSPIKASAVFVAVFAPTAVLFGDDRAVGLIADAAVASVLLVLSYRAASSLYCDISQNQTSSVRSYRTQILKNTVGGISKRLSDICGKPSPSLRPVSDVVYAKVCLGCQKSSECFGTGPQRPDCRDFSDLGELCRALPKCTRIPEIRKAGAEALRRREYMSGRNSDRINALRLCSGMLTALQGVVSDTEDVALKSVTKDENMSACFERELKKSGVRFDGCVVYPNGTVELCLPAAARVNELKIASAASEVTGVDYMKPERTDLDGGVLYRLLPKPAYSVETGACQLPAGNETSGDVAETFVIGQNSYTVLSDGMGVGGYAHAVSVMLVDLIKELLTAGFSAETAIRLSSVILTSSVPEESFATLDLLKVDLNTGAGELYKAGGCASLLISGETRSVLKAGGYPIGILDSCDIKVYRFFAGDFSTLVMMTDGAGELDAASCSKTLDSAIKLPSAELAAMLMSEGEPEKLQKHDDISVAVVKIQRRAA